MRVLFSSVPAPSHVAPMLVLARAMAERHEVVFATGPASVPRVEASGLRAVPVGLDWWEPEAQRTFPELSALPLEEVAAWWFSEIFLERAGRPMAKDLVGLLDTEPVDLVVRTQLEFGAWAAAQVREVPQVVFGLGGTARENELPALSERLASLLDSVGFSGQLDEVSTFGDLFLMLHPESYDPWVPPVPTHRFRPPVPFPAGSTSARPQVLDGAGDEPVVLVTFGTVFNRTPGVFEMVLEALGELSVWAVVTVGTTRDPAELGAVPENVRVRQYVPYDELLPHCDAVVCHGGFNTTMAALAHGLPLVIVPLSADQPWNAACCRDLGVAEAMTFREATAVRVRDAVRTVLHDASYRERAQRFQQELHALEPLERALPVLEEVGAAATG